MQTDFFDKMILLKYETKGYLRYLYALLAIPIVVLTGFALSELTNLEAPFITLFPVTVMIALLGGMGPAIVTGVIGVFLCDYFFIEPSRWWEIGLAFWIRTSIVVLTSVFVGYVGAVLREARLRAENQAIELNRSRQDLKRAQAVAHTGSWRLDTRNNKLLWSDEAYRIFGVPFDTPLTYESFLSFIHPDDRECVDKNWEAALKGAPYDIEHRIMVADLIKWVHEKAELEYENGGKLAGGFGTVTDITERKKREEELHRLNRTLRALSKSTQTIMHAKDELKYLQNVCDIIINDCGHAMVWIGLAENDEAKTVKPLVCSGFEEGYLDTLRITWANAPRGRGPTGTAIRTGKASICKNIPINPAFEPWRDDAVKRGYASSISLPLLNGDKAFGALTIYSRQVDPFTKDEVNLLTELAGDLSLGISTIRLRIARDKAEDSLRQNEATLRGILDATKESIWLFSTDGVVVTGNPTALSRFKNPADEIIGRHISDFLPPELAKSRFARLREVVKSAGPLEFVDTRDEIIFHHSFYPVQDSEGHVTSVVSFSRDITESKKAEEALRESERNYRELVQSANSAIIRWNRNGNITLFNEYAQQFFGYSAEEALGRKVDFLLPDGDSADTDLSELIDNILEDPQHYVNNINENLCRDGRRVWMAWTNKPIYGEDGQLLEILAIGTDITKRREMEEEVRKSRDELEIRVKERTAELEKASMKIQSERQRFNDVLETLPAYICLLTPDYYMPFANKVFRDLFGYYPDKKCYEFLFDCKKPCENCETYQVLETGKRQHWEWTGPNGRNYDIFDFPFKDTDGSQLILEMGIDITERKKAQEELRSALLYSRSLLEASLDPLVTISADGKITDVNEATVQVTGVSRDKLIGTDFSNYYTEPDNAREGYQQVFAQGFVMDYPLTIRHKDGKLTDVLYNATVYKDEEGHVQGIFAAARDVTEKKQTERRQGVTNALLELYARKTSRKEYLGSAVDVIRDWSGCSSVGIRIKDSEGNIPYESSAGFEENFIDLESPLNLGNDRCLCIRAILRDPDMSDKELLTPGGSFYSNDSLAFLKRLSREQAKNYRAQCMKQGFQSIGIIPIRYRDEILGAIHIADTEKDKVPLKNVQFIESTIAPLIGEAINRFNAEAELEKYRVHLEEIVKQRTEELARSNKDLEQFAYVASHDLQEPLRAVAGFVGLLQRQMQHSLNDKIEEYMNYTVDGVHRMQTLINGLLAYSRIDTRGKPPVRTHSNKALQEAILDLQKSVEESGAKVTFDKLPVVNIDPVQLTQLFQNLISNAIKFRSERLPEIHVSATRQENAWQFAVKDNGIGIEPQYAERIFMIFQRLHTRKKYPGTGIGLSLCKKIVERHGGKIRMESEPGKGSTFYFTIPDLEGQNR